MGHSPVCFGQHTYWRGFPDYVWVRFDEPTVELSKKEQVPEWLGEGEAVPCMHKQHFCKKLKHQALHVTLTLAYSVSIHSIKMTISSAAVHSIPVSWTARHTLR